MNYAIRNTIILMILLIILVSGFVIANTRLSKERNLFNVQLTEITNNLKNLKLANPDYNDIEELTINYQKMYKHDQRYGKIIPETNSPTDSYLYLLDLIDKYSPNMDFDFRLRENSNNDYAFFNRYEINGISNINSLYKLVSQIEKNIMLYTVENLEIMEEMTTDPITENPIFDQVSFNLSINAYYQEDIVETILNKRIRTIASKSLPYNPFRTRIYAPKFDSEEEEFINIDYASVIGLTPDRVFLRNDNEEIVTLQTGDKVAYGNLESIDWENQFVVFKINRTGITESKILYFYKE